MTTDNDAYREWTDDDKVACYNARVGLHPQIDLRAVYGRGDGGENIANHRRNLKDPGTCQVPKGETITLAEWRRQQDA